MRRFRTVDERDGDSVKVAIMMTDYKENFIGYKVLAYNKGKINMTEVIYPKEPTYPINKSN